MRFHLLSRYNFYFTFTLLQRQPRRQANREGRWKDRGQQVLQQHKIKLKKKGKKKYEYVYMYVLGGRVVCVPQGACGVFICLDSHADKQAEKGGGKIEVNGYYNNTKESWKKGKEKICICIYWEGGLCEGSTLGACGVYICLHIVRACVCERGGGGGGEQTV